MITSASHSAAHQPEHFDLGGAQRALLIESHRRALPLGTRHLTSDGTR